MWFRVDDKLWGSPKWLSLRPAARALWVTAGAWSMDQLTDGHVPSHVLPILGGRPSDADALVTSGLWEKDDDDGYNFHDWHDWQPTRDAIIEKREAEAARKAEWRKRRAEKRQQQAENEQMSQRDTDGTEAGQGPDATRDGRGTDAGVPHMSRSSRPDPTRPDPTTPKGVPSRERSTTSLSARDGDDFDAFWDAYPRRVGRQAAQKAWPRAVRTAGSAERIIAGARAYAADPNREARFTAHPTTWLNQGRWDDDPLPDRTSTPTGNLMRAELERARQADAAEASTGLRAIGGGR